MKVKLIAIHEVRYGGKEPAEPGDEFEVDQETAEGLVKSGAARVVEEAPKRRGRPRKSDVDPNEVGV